MAASALLLGSLAVTTLANGSSYRFERFEFPEPPRTAVGVKYQAGDVESAAPLGGLGTGTVYFDSRGRFSGQAIANSYRPVGGPSTSSGPPQVYPPEAGAGGPSRAESRGGVMTGCGFTVGIESGGRAFERPLEELARTYLGHFPMVDLEAADEAVPVTLQLRAMSPFILGDARASATPAAMFRLRATNAGAKEAKVSITFSWYTPVQPAADGASARGNVDGFLMWKLGDLAPGARTTVPVEFAAANSIGELKERLKAPSGDIVVDDDGAFNWEDSGRQCLTTGAGGCLSHHGFYLHYDLAGPRRAGTAVVGAPRLENLLRVDRADETVRLRTSDGALLIEVHRRDGMLVYVVENTGAEPVRGLRLSVYANLEAGHTEGDDSGRLDPELRAVVVTDETGAACALASDRPADAGWCGLWGATLERMRDGKAIAFTAPEEGGVASPHRRTSVIETTRYLSITREDTRDYSGCTIAALRDEGTTLRRGPTDSAERTSVTATVALEPGQSREARFVLAWFYPDARDSGGRFVGHQYANWFESSAAVARHVARNFDALARRVGEWQEAIYGEPRAPEWLKDQLVNSLYSLARNTSWLKDGRFTHSESFIGCPITETIVCRFYGSLPLAMFFPELEKNTMRQFIHHQRGDGAIAFAFGAGENWDAPFYETQQIIDSSEFALLAWRDYAWWRERAWADEVYPAVKKAIGFARSLDTDGDGLINDELSRQYYDCWQFHGASAYTSGIWLAALKAASAFAELEGDQAFRDECEALFAKAQASFEQKLWAGSYYRLWNDTARGERSDTCLAAQLTGQWYAYLCGLGEILPREHIVAALEHIARTNGAGDVWALVNGITADGSRDKTGANGHSDTATLGETWCYAATCVYAGRPELGLPRAMRLAENIALRQRRTWDTTWNLDPDTGEMLWGREYYSNMCVWDLWGALTGRDSGRGEVGPAGAPGAP